MRMHNLHGTEKEKEGEESSDEESDDDEEDQDTKPQMELAMMPHYGGINRVRVCCVIIFEAAIHEQCWVALLTLKTKGGKNGRFLTKNAT